MTDDANRLGLAEWIYLKLYLGQAVDKFDGLILESLAADEALAQRHQRPEGEADDRAPVVVRSQLIGETGVMRALRDQSATGG